MPESLVIISPDANFSATLAAHIQTELALSCQIVANNEQAKPYIDSAIAAITTEPSDDSFACPVIKIESPPIRLQDILENITTIIQSHSAVDLPLGAYSLQLRQKQLLHKASGKSVLLTDKEVQLLQNLAEIKGQGVSKDQLLKNVWGFDEALDTHTLETHVYRLRGKFRELAGEEVIAATEGGYRLEML